MQPLLSICIPTYNRAEFLEKTLFSITEQGIFQNSTQVEIIICDNLSQDTTQDIAQSFLSKYPDKITYIRHKKAIPGSQNFVCALRHAKGKLAKLHNDTHVLFDNCLEQLIKDIEQIYFDQSKPMIFFLNGNTDTIEPVTYCDNMGKFLEHVSFMITWIGGFALWQEQIEEYTEFFFHEDKHKEKYFGQVEAILFALENDKKFSIINIDFCSSPSHVKKATDVNFLNNVYVNEYLPLLQNYLHKGMISKNIYDAETRKFIFLYYMWYYTKLVGGFSFSYIKDFRATRPYIPTFLYVKLCIVYIFYGIMYPCLKFSIVKKCIKIIKKYIRSN